MRFLIILLFVTPSFLQSQNISINEDGSAPHPSAILDIQSTTKGLLIPRADTSSIFEPAEGLLLFQPSDKSYYYFKSGVWQALNASTSLNYPQGMIVHTDTFPNEALENVGFSLYGSYELSYEDRRDDGQNYGEWSSIPNTAPTELIANRGWWTGSKLLLWGGNLADTSNVGALYDPINNTWTSTSLVNAPSPRRNFAAVWTGAELLVFGGNTNAGDVNDLFSYNPVTDSWIELMDPNPPTPRQIFKEVWTGDALMFYGGDTIISGSSRRESNEGYYYHLATNQWTKMSTINGPQAFQQPGLSWAGDRLVVFGGWTTTGYSSCNTNGVDQKYYDPSTDTWNSTGIFVARKWDVGIHVGGFSYFAGGRKIKLRAVSGGPFGGGSCDFDGYTDYGLSNKYDPVSNSWSVSTNNILPQALGETSRTQMIAKDDTLILWGHEQNELRGQLIATSTNENWEMSRRNGPPSDFYTSHWIGNKMLCYAKGQDIYFFDPSKKGLDPTPTLLTKTMYLYRKE